MPVLQFCCMGCSHSEACVGIEPTAWAFGGAASCFQCVSGWGVSHPGPAAYEDTFVLGSANPHGLRCRNW